MTIQSNGTINGNGHNAIELKGSNGSTRTLAKLINEGTIKGKIGIENGGSDFSGTITVKNFENKKTIDGHIYMGIWRGNGTISIETFNNEGTITSNDNDGVIYFEGTTHIKTFKNTGTIEGKNNQNSITVKAQNNQTPILENFINEGFIKGKIGMQVNGDQNTGSVIVNTFHNKGGGTIDGRVYYGWSKDGTISIETFNNEGTINYNNTSNGGKAAVEFEKINVTINTFENEGTIKSE
ncbi:autotransporter outer membrane beta-barrel domain-containing protein, partial [Campylobacter jejuni]